VTRATWREGSRATRCDGFARASVETLSRRARRRNASEILYVARDVTVKMKL